MFTAARFLAIVQLAFRLCTAGCTGEHGLYLALPLSRRSKSGDLGCGEHDWDQALPLSPKKSENLSWGGA